MIGSIDRERREAVVVGAGFAGLAIADALVGRGYDVRVLEASPRAGGLIETRETPYGIAEGAAHSVLATKPVDEFFSRIGVELAGARQKKRFILRDGRLRRFPLGPGELASMLWRLGTRRGRAGIATFDDWAMEFLGEAGRDYLISPFLRGIYGAEPGELSVEAAFPRLVVPEGRRALAALRAKPAAPHGEMRVPRAGMEEVIRKLRERLGDRIRTGESVARLPDSANIVLCVPAPSAATLLGSEDPALASALRGVQYTPMTSVTAFVPLARAPEGVGVLFPKREGRRALGVLFNSSAFEGRVADPALASLTVMFRGNEENAAAELQELWGLEPVHLEVFRRERGIPVYGSSLPPLWALARAGWCSRPGRVLFSNWTGQVSLRGMIETLATLEA